MDKLALALKRLLTEEKATYDPDCCHLDAYHGLRERLEELSKQYPPIQYTDTKEMFRPTHEPRKGGY